MSRLINKVTLRPTYRHLFKGPARCQFSHLRSGILIAHHRMLVAMMGGSSRICCLEPSALTDAVEGNQTRRGKQCFYFPAAEGHRASGDKNVSGADTDLPSIFYRHFPRGQRGGGGAEGGGGAVVNPSWTRLRFTERQTTASSHTWGRLEVPVSRSVRAEDPGQQACRLGRSLQLLLTEHIHWN